MRYGDFIRTEAGSKAMLDVDLLVLNDNLSVETVKMLRAGKAFDASKVLIVVDQVVPPNSPEQSARQRQLMKLSDEQGIEILYGAGMTGNFLIHGRLKAGQIAAAVNQSVVMAGAVGALGICIGEEQLLGVFSSGIVGVTVPRWEDVSFTGRLQAGAAAMDVALAAVKTLGISRNGTILCVSGSLIYGLTADEKATVCAVLKQTGAESVVLEQSVGETAGKSKSAGWNVELGEIEPMAALENGYDRIEIVREMEPLPVNVVFIGGSAGGNLQDIRILAEALKGNKIAYGVRLCVAPSDQAVYRQMADEGCIATILDAGGLVLNQCAAPDSQCRIGEHERMVSNDWINHPGYAGYDTSEIVTASVETAARAALTGAVGGGDRNKDEIGKSATESRTVVLEGKCWKFGDDIDTDIIIPTQWVCVPMDEMRRHAFEPLRPGVADRMGEGDVIVAGENFGCGSSREMAAEVIAENGIRCIIAKSFARIFFRNAINNGILLIECRDLPDEVQEGDVVQVELNRQITCNGKVYPIGKIHENLYEIIADGGLVKNIEKKVKRGLL